jgi:hypothetical protein
LQQVAGLKEPKMPSGATGRFTNPENYAANLRAIAVELVVTGSDRSDSCLAWAHLTHLDLLYSDESLPRIARRHTDILARFEHQLAAQPDRLLPMPRLPM